MAYNETRVTLAGSVASEVTCTKVGTGYSRANFRMLTRERRWDFDRKEWVDGNHMFLSVTCWRDLADNVKASLARHDPVVVAGKLTVKELPEGAGRYRQFIDVEAYAVGIDLTKCAAAITKPDPPPAKPSTAKPTASPPTASPPTASPPTASPPTASPPTASPPTASPPTASPPTASPPTASPPTADPATASPPTADSATASPPTADSATASPPTADSAALATQPTADSAALATQPTADPAALATQPPDPTTQPTLFPPTALATPRKEGEVPRTRRKRESPLKEQEVDKVPF
ncbi:single-stranded DNA-binding protein [Actinosynnema sp. CA-248983]